MYASLIMQEVAVQRSRSDVESFEISREILQAVIPPPLFPASTAHLPILPPHQASIKHSGDQPQDRHAHANTIPLMIVLRRIRRQERKCRNDPPRISKADHPRRADAPLDMPFQIHDIPTHDDRPSGKGSHGHEMDREIFDLVRVVHRHEDGEADDDEDLAEEDVRKADFGKVGGEGEEEAEAESGNDRGDGVELSLDGGVPESFDDGGGEIGEGVDGDDDGCGKKIEN